MICMHVSLTIGLISDQNGATWRAVQGGPQHRRNTVAKLSRAFGRRPGAARLPTAIDDQLCAGDIARQVGA